MAGRVCVITGGNAGIGKATATALARQGAHVVLACMSPSKVGLLLRLRRDTRIALYIFAVLLVGDERDWAALWFPLSVCYHSWRSCGVSSLGGAEHDKPTRVLLSAMCRGIAVAFAKAPVSSLFVINKQAEHDEPTRVLLSACVEALLWRSRRPLCPLSSVINKQAEHTVCLCRGIAQCCGVCKGPCVHSLPS